MRGATPSPDRLDRAVLEALAARGLLAAGALDLLGGQRLEPDPLTALIRAGHLSLDQLAAFERDLAGAARGSSDQDPTVRFADQTDRILEWIENARTVATAAVEPRARRDETLDTGEARARGYTSTRTRRPMPGELSAMAPWQSPFPESPAGGPPPPRFEIDRADRFEAGRSVHPAIERVLERRVEIHFPLSSTNARSFGEAARILAGIRGPGVPILFETGTDPDGRPFLVLSPPAGETLRAQVARTLAGVAGAATRRALLAAIARAAVAVDRAHQRGVSHLALSPDTLFLGRHGEVTVTAWGSPETGPEATAGPTGSSAVWAERDSDLDRDPYCAPEIFRRQRRGPQADIYSLGMLANLVAYGRPVRSIMGRRARLAPGVPAEVASVALRATERRPSHRYTSAGEFAREIERALAGEAVSAAASPLSRRIQRIARHYPRLALVCGLTLLAAISGAAIVAVEASGRARATAGVLAARREAALARASELSGELAGAMSVFEDSLDLERRALDQVREIHGRVARPGAWGPDPTGVRSLDFANNEAIAQRGRTRPHLERVLDRGRWVLELVARIDAQGDRADEGRAAGRLTREARLVMCESLLLRVDLDLESADLELVRTRSWESPARVVESQKDAARHLKTLSECLSSPDWEPPRALGERRDALAARMTGRSRLVVDMALDRDLAELLLWRVDPAGPSFALWNVGSISPGRPIELDSGEYVLEVRRDGRGFRVDLVLAPGELAHRTIEWPVDWPPGDFAYLPPGEFHAGGDGENSGPYRMESIADPCFIGRREVTLGEYLAYLKSLREGSRSADLEAARPRIHTPTELVPLFDENLGVRIPGYSDEMPIGGVSAGMAERYAAWRGADSRFSYRLPSEAEWEYAARGTSGRTYPWGAGTAPSVENVAGLLVGPFWLVPAGTPEEGQSVFGVAGLGGNVREWTASRTADSSGELRRVLRGGWFSSSESWARASSRELVLDSFFDPSTGFRLVATPRAR